MNRQPGETSLTPTVYARGPFFIKCHSAMDQTFIGPFQFKKDALIFMRQHGNPEHDSWIFTKAMMEDDLAKYGKIVIQTVEGFVHDLGR